MRALVITTCLIALAASLPALAEVRQPAPTWQQVKLAERRAEVKVLRAQNRRLRREHMRGVHYAIRLASSAYGVSRSELYAVARCESNLTATAQNRTSSAAGLFQFLDSTWEGQGMDGFSVYDPVANALAAARIVRREGWRQWSCGWAAR